MGGVFRRELDNDKQQTQEYKKLRSHASKADFRHKWALMKMKAHSNYVLGCMLFSVQCSGKLAI